MKADARMLMKSWLIQISKHWDTIEVKCKKGWWYDGNTDEKYYEIRRQDAKKYHTDRQKKSSNI